MNGLRILDAAAVRRALPMPRAIAAMREAFALLQRGAVTLPPRAALPLGGEAVTLVMPGRAPGRYALGVKLVSVVPANAARGAPVVQGVVLLLDAETGAPAAVLDGTALTAIRTGAASGLATDLLARPDAGTLALLGAGAQARTQAEAVLAVRTVRAIRVWSRTRARAERFAAELAAAAPAAAVTVCRTPAEAARGADVVCTATAAAAPLLRDEDVGPGTHVNAVGSFTPAMREVDPALLGRARVVVDQRAAALAEAGEVIAAVGAGLVEAEGLAELGAVVTGEAPGRQSAGEVTVFKSVGLAAQDLVAGAWALEGS